MLLIDEFKLQWLIPIPVFLDNILFRAYHQNNGNNPRQIGERNYSSEETCKVSLPYSLKRN